ncbi:MAG: hypothetical protein KJ847_00515 [Firmicutes bacterium]|nr:hypothetical protein [Bacillota bacterium]
MKVMIDDNLKTLTPNFSVGVLECNVEIGHSNLVNHLVEELELLISSTINIEDVVQLDIIKDGRDAYKIYGKDPSRYRLAVESLYRRLSKGNSLYRINNCVDLGNIISIKTRKSVAVLDYDRIKSDILIRLGKNTDLYEGIGRGKLNIENIPLYEDSLGPFGSVTSDTERTMITENTKRVLLFIISFSGKNGLYDELEYAKNLFDKYANGSDFDYYIL